MIVLLGEEAYTDFPAFRGECACSGNALHAIQTATHCRENYALLESKQVVVFSGLKEAGELG